jgi:phosphatidyl-myo-inositol alpha-mannosyltransferase
MPLKIGLVSPYDFSYPGGVNNHIKYLASNFVKWGHDVKILAPQSQPNKDSNLPIIPVGHPFPLSGLGTVSRIPVSPWLPLKVKNTIRKEKFDVLHIHEPLLPILPLSALLSSSCINIGTFHAYHGSPKFYQFTKRYLTRCLPRLNGRIAVSEPALQFVSSQLPGEYRLIPNGVDTSRFSPGNLRRPEFSDDKLNILYVGRLEKRKGVEYLIKAYALIKNRLPMTRLIIVGSGTRWSRKLHTLIKNIAVQDVIFKGYVDDIELPSYYCSADVFCSPAIFGESFGIVLLEAMACRIPVVASNIDGYSEVISNGEEGLLTEPGNEDDLARSLLTVLENPSLRMRMGSEGAVKARSFDWQKVAARVMSYYEECITEKGDTTVRIPRQCTAR